MANEEGFYILNSSYRREEAIKHLKHIDRGPPIMCVSIKEYRDTRSQAQNRLYWMWVNIIAKDQGNTPEELHEALKVRFLGFEVKHILGREVVIGNSTKELTTKEFTEYLNKVEALAQALEIKLPIPDDYGYAMGHKESKTDGKH